LVGAPASTVAALRSYLGRHLSQVSVLEDRPAAIDHLSVVTIDRMYVVAKDIKIVVPHVGPVGRSWSGYRRAVGWYLGRTEQRQQIEGMHVSVCGRGVRIAWKCPRALSSGFDHRVFLSGLAKTGRNRAADQRPSLATRERRLGREDGERSLPGPGRL